jgi:plasmid maintenance system antidote protein VapI
MTLREFKDKRGLRTEDLADLLDLSIGHTSDLINGRRSCSLEVAVRIEELTRGRVRCRDLIAAAV